MNELPRWVMVGKSLILSAHLSRYSTYSRLGIYVPKEVRTRIGGQVPGSSD
jgi:hypothetical protein